MNVCRHPWRKRTLVSVVTRDINVHEYLLQIYYIIFILVLISLNGPHVSLYVIPITFLLSIQQ